MTGLIVACCTLGSICNTTCPPRWISPRTGGLSFSCVPRRASPSACGAVPAAPFCDLGRLALVPGHNVDFVDLDFAGQRRGRYPRRQVMAQMLGHDLHVRAVQAKLRGDLPGGEVQSHQVKAQHPHPQRLMMPRQRRAGEIVETPVARLAAIALPMRLLLVMPVPDDCRIATTRAAHALRPAMLADQRKA